MLKSKTLWTGITGVIGALAGYMTGELEIGSVVECDGEMCVIYRKTRRKRKR